MKYKSITLAVIMSLFLISNNLHASILSEAIDQFLSDRHEYLCVNAGLNHI